MLRGFRPARRPPARALRPARAPVAVLVSWTWCKCVRAATLADFPVLLGAPVSLCFASLSVPPRLPHARGLQRVDRYDDDDDDDVEMLMHLGVIPASPRWLTTLLYQHRGISDSCHREALRVRSSVPRVRTLTGRRLGPPTCLLPQLSLQPMRVVG
jgi:hypothetical protein